MIQVKTKIHDRYSVEFKIGFEGSEKQKKSEFAINTWLFLPASLDINEATYGKYEFRRDVKSNVRLITPDFTLKQLSNPSAQPYVNIKECNDALQIRIFASIVKSALRDETDSILEDRDGVNERCRLFAEHTQQILHQFRKLDNGNNPDTDEYLSHLVERYTIKLMEEAQEADQDTRNVLKDLMMKERTYQKQHGFLYLSPTADNASILRNHNRQKKSIESPLYLSVNTRKDGKKMEQFWFGVAAGLAMILSTLIALPFQHYWSNYPAFIFAILVVAYMLKDRSKEYMRGIFANQLKNRYFDYRTTIGINDTPLGWIKESVDFVKDTPYQVRQHRLMLSSTRNLDSILLYRKRVFVDNERLQNQHHYNFEGIHDIMRLHLRTFTHKMDDPSVIIHTLDDDGERLMLNVPRIYTFYIVMQFLEKGASQPEYKTFSIDLTRDGIVSVKN